MTNFNTPENYDKCYIEQPHRWYPIEACDRYILSLIKKLYGDKGIKLIDMGCGNGRTIDCIKELKTLNITGIDFSPVALEKSRTRNPETEIKLLNMDMRKTTFKDKEFDIVLSVGSHEHLPTIDFSEPRRLIKDDGLFVCILPDVVRDAGWAGDDVNQQWNLTKDTWIKHLERFNFKVIDYSSRWIFVCYPVLTIEQLAKKYYNFKILLPNNEKFIIRQNLEEVQMVIDYLAGRKFNNFVEIGSSEGGSLWLYANALCFKDANVISIEPVELQTLSYSCQKIKETGRKINHILGKSQDVINQIPNNIDLLHIDGNHTFKDVKKEYELYSAKMIDNGIILIHDTMSTHPGPPELREELEQKNIINKTFVCNNPKCGVSLITK